MSSEPEKCGQPAASFIPRWGMSFACVLPKGHEGEHQQGGNCFKHGEYVGKQCPQWPNCLPGEPVRPATPPEARGGTCLCEVTSNSWSNSRCPIHQGTNGFGMNGVRYVAPAVPDAAARAALNVWRLVNGCDNDAQPKDKTDHVDIGAIAALIREAGEMRPAPFPDCNVGTPHECCVARMKRLERERSVASPAVPPKLTAEQLEKMWMAQAKHLDFRNFLIQYIIQHVAAGETQDAPSKFRDITGIVESVNRTMEQQAEYDNLNVERYHEIQELKRALAKAESEALKLREALRRYEALEYNLPKGFEIGDDATAELAIKLAEMKESLLLIRNYIQTNRSALIVGEIERLLAGEKVTT